MIFRDSIKILGISIAISVRFFFKRASMEWLRNYFKSFFTNATGIATEVFLGGFQECFEKFLSVIPTETSTIFFSANCSWNFIRSISCDVFRYSCRICSDNLPRISWVSSRYCSNVTKEFLGQFLKEFSENPWRFVSRNPLKTPRNTFGNNEKIYLDFLRGIS